MPAQITLEPVVLCEGRYDKARLASLFDAVIIPVGGFSIYRNQPLIKQIRTMSEQHGAIIVMDSDAAGFQLRHFLTQKLSGEKCIQVYMPDVLGKERRKTHASKEGKLGVEGIENRLVLEAFAQAGALPGQPEKEPPAAAREPITKADLFSDGLSGGSQSVQRRAALQAMLGLPRRMNPNELLIFLNRRYSKEEYHELIAQMDQP